MSNQFWKPSLADRSKDDNIPIYKTSRGMSIEHQRLLLPIYEFRNSILYALEKNRVVVLVSETGTGKSTQIPQYLHESGWTANGKGIAITQPRRIAAMTISSRVAEEMKTVLGEEVGYVVRFEQKSSSRTVIKYCTDGVLLRETMTDPLLSSYNVVMVDEAHERSLNTDIILGILKKILRKRPDLRVIVTSATIDANEIKGFFDSAKSKLMDNSLNQSCIINVQGSRYPIDLLYLNEPCRNYIETAVDTAVRIHKTEGEGDILIFLPGGEEIDTAVHLLRDSLEDGFNNARVCILPLYSSLPTHVQMEVFNVAPPGTRKIIVATNIAETSVTIDGIKFVVDAGFVKLNYFNAYNGIDALVTCPISKASARQRAGRAGRTAPGRCFRLMTEACFQQLSNHSLAEMQRTDIAWAVLQLKSLGIQDVLHFDFLSPPPAESMIFALEVLFSLGALDLSGNLTSVGEKMAEMPIEPRMAKCLLSSWDFGCGEELLSIAAMCSVEYPFITQRAKASQDAKKRLADCISEFVNPLGDHLTLLAIYSKYQEAGHSSSWCDSFCLQGKLMARAREIRSHLKALLLRYQPDGGSLASCQDDDVAIRKCLVSGYFSHAAQLAPDGNYQSIRGKVSVTMHPTSVLARFGSVPEWVIFSEIIQSKAPQIRDVTKIEPLWLMEIANHYYTVSNLQL